MSVINYCDICGKETDPKEFKSAFQFTVPKFFGKKDSNMTQEPKTETYCGSCTDKIKTALGKLREECQSSKEK